MCVLLFKGGCDLEYHKLIVKNLIFIGNSLDGVPLLWQQVSIHEGYQHVSKATHHPFLSFTHLNKYTENMLHRNYCFYSFFCWFVF